MDESSDSGPFAEPPSDGVHGQQMRARIAHDLFGTEHERTRVGRFELGECLGEGGMGQVFRAWDPDLEREVAIKLLHAGSGDPARRRERIRREAKSLARLSHPNVVQVFEVGRHDERVFLAMELVRGETLAEWLGPQRPHSEILECVLQAGRGLAAAHEAGLVHRDFKPANVLVGVDGRARVADFGLADPVVPSETSSSSSDLGDEAEGERARSITSARGPGTIAYMSPEQIRGRSIDDRSDQFSFCAVLWEALYGCRPYTPEQVRARGHDLGEPSAERPPSRRDQIARALRRGLARSANERWPGMSELLRELEPPATRRTAWRYVGVGALAMAGLGLAWASFDQLARCDEPDVLVQSVVPSKARDALEERLLRSPAYEEPAALAMLEGLDEYAEQWALARHELCRATPSGRATGSHAKAEACLGQAEGRLRQTVALLVDADADKLVKADDLLGNLDRLNDCEDEARLAFAPPVPSDPDVAEAVLAGRTTLGEVEALIDAGRWEQAGERLHRVVETATEADFASLRAEAARLDGKAARLQGHYDRAHGSATEAMLLAQREDLVRTNVEAMRELALIEADAYADYDVARSRLDLADATASRLPEGDSLRTRLRLTRARLDRMSGSSEAALAQLDELAAVESLDDDVRRRVQLERAHGLANLGRVPEAQHIYERRLAEVREHHGSTHPQVAAQQYNIGLLLRDAGEYESALPWAEQALSTADRVYPGSVERASYLVLLAELALANDDPTRARTLADEARSLQQQLPPGHEERGGALALLAAIDEHEGLMEDMLDRYRELSDLWVDDPQGLHIDNNLTWQLCMTGRCEAGRTYAARMLARVEPPHILDLLGRTYVAWADVEAGRFDEAQQALERLRLEARVLQTKDPEEQAVLAELGLEIEWLVVLTKLGQGRDPDEWVPVAETTLASFESAKTSEFAQLQAPIIRFLRNVLDASACNPTKGTTKEIATLKKSFWIDKEAPAAKNAGIAKWSRKRPTPSKSRADDWMRLQCLLRGQGRAALFGLDQWSPTVARTGLDKNAGRVAEATVMLVGRTETGSLVDDSSGQWRLTETTTLETDKKKNICKDGTEKLKARELARVPTPPDDTSCTGILVGPQSILTLKHCAIDLNIEYALFRHIGFRDPTGFTAAKVSKIYFESDHGITECEWKGSELECEPIRRVADKEAFIRSFRRHECSDELGTPPDPRKEEGWALVVLNEKRKGHLDAGDFLTSPPEVGTEVVSIGHPRGLPQLRSHLGVVLPPKLTSYGLVSLRVEPGSSGSPVVRTDGTIVGLTSADAGHHEYMKCDDDGTTRTMCRASLRCLSLSGCGESHIAYADVIVSQLCAALRRPELDSIEVHICKKTP